MTQKKMVASQGDSSLSHSAVGSHRPQLDWDSIDDEFKAILSPIQLALNIDNLNTCEVSMAFADSLHSHLEFHGALGRISSTSDRPSTTKGPHKVRSIVKLTTRLAREKNSARRHLSSSPPAFLNGVRAHNKAIKAARKVAQSRSARLQERAFKTNKLPHSPSRSAMTTLNPYFLGKTVFPKLG